MANSDSDQFESADEEFSDSDVTKIPCRSDITTQVVTHHDSSSSGNFKKHDVSSTFENLSLQKSMSSSRNSSPRELTSSSKDIFSSRQSKAHENTEIKPEISLPIEKEINQISTLETVDQSKVVNYGFKTSMKISEQTGVSVKDNSELSTGVSTSSISKNEETGRCKLDVKLPSEKPLPDECRSLEPSFDSHQSPKSASESQCYQGLQQAQYNLIPKNCEINPVAGKGLTTKLATEDLNIAPSNDVCEPGNILDSNSKLMLPSFQKSETSSNSEFSIKKKFDESLWKSEDALENNPKLFKFQPTEISCKITPNPQSTIHRNFREEHLSESSRDDGWEMEDFEIDDRSVNSPKLTKKNAETAPSLGETDDIDNDAAWNDGWDTDEVTFSPDPPQDQFKQSEHRSDSSKLKSTDGLGTETLQSIKQENETSPNEIKISKVVMNETAKTAQQKQPDGWFGWGMTNILSSATEGLSSITSNVTSAFESTIGAPDPKEILRAQKEASLCEETAPAGTTEPQEGSGFTENLFSVSSWTKFVESTGSKVLTTGLDTLETIGKKTMEVIQEGDPGLKKKRAKLREFVSEPGKPVLSQVLREAKEKAETCSRKNEAALIESRANFEILFDDFEGLVHLEALEMISKQCQIRLESLSLKFSGDEAKNFKETLQEIEELCELPEDDESDSAEAMVDSGKFKLRIEEVLAKLDVEIQCDKLFRTSEIVERKLNKDYTDSLQLYQVVISSLAEISAAAMQIFHRAAEMLVIKSKHSTIAETDSLMSFGKLVCSKLEVTAEKFSLKLKNIDPSETSKVSHILEEASNSITYTQNACHLLVPILQYGAVV